MDKIYSYGPGFIIAMIGIFLLVSASTGGGFSLFGLPIPKVEKAPRMVTGILGILLLLSGATVGLASYGASVPETAPTMDMRGYVTLAPPTMDMSNYVTRSAPTMDMSNYVTVAPPTMDGSVDMTGLMSAGSEPCTNQTDMGTLDEANKQVCMMGAYVPCLRWDEVSASMKDATICMRGLIRRIDQNYENNKWLVHWDFTDNRTGFFALSNYQGWHPITGRGMAAGDCVAIVGKVQVLKSGRPYVFWGENSIFKSAVSGSGGYFEHPDMWVMEGNQSFCQ